MNLRTGWVAVTVAVAMAGAGPWTQFATAQTHSAVSGVSVGDRTVSWEKQSAKPAPERRHDHAMAFDAGRGEVVLFGGYNEGHLGDTWTWDGSAWKELTGSPQPPARQDHMMAYDPVRDEVVLFGGDSSGSGPESDGVERNDDTWILKNGKWSQRLPDSSPRPTESAAMAFDPNRQQVILFGGYDTQELSDTWAWDGSTWTKLSPAESPPARSSTDLAFDPTRNALILFSGSNDDRDTWSWDGKTWTELSLRRAPIPRGLHSMATFGKHVVLFGGQADFFRMTAGTWVLKSGSWKRLHPDVSPAGRQGAELEWDSVRDEAVLFGGQGRASSCPAVTWTLDPAGPSADRSLTNQSLANQSLVTQSLANQSLAGLVTGPSDEGC